MGLTSVRVGSTHVYGTPLCLLDSTILYSTRSVLAGGAVLVLLRHSI